MIPAHIIERMARALCLDYDSDWPHPTYSEDGWQKWTTGAQAALAAVPGLEALIEAAMSCTWSLNSLQRLVDATHAFACANRERGE